MVESGQNLPFSSAQRGYFLLISSEICWHIVVLKKNSVTLLKIALLGPYLGKNWASMSHAQNEAQFLLEITKGDHKLSRTFCFKNIISFD